MKDPALFEQTRQHLLAVCYRMLGSLAEAEDAVQETWLRYDRTDTTDVANIPGWLTTVAGRVCLDMLRSRTSRREDALDDTARERRGEDHDPAAEAELAESVGLAMMVVLDALAPAERLAFVLHDMFAVPFDDIAPIVDRNPAATRQLASRARRRVQGAPLQPAPEAARKREVVDAFLTAAREGQFERLLEILDPDVVCRGDALASLRGGPDTIGRRAVAERFNGTAQAARSLLVDGEFHAVVAPYGRMLLVLRFTVVDGLVTEIEAVMDPESLARMEFAAGTA
ncbi:RNA polymerase sigma factor [Actinorhabdospora filicis]|uniref:RNA polymerase sigma factor n=1 Tax=Actinorhabdospora filicis TaxID=1785913 RepID=A0A9W6SQU2_9ACTN|nr:sigma-70 family RNA polymerase sigma factor [Actinorhabdospora filicis]GLZ81254.1 RNA polymerase sigma factor [Actinorhabdospora filicis]